MSNTPSSETVSRLIEKLIDYEECEEYHIHDGSREHEGSTPLPHDFDDEAFELSLRQAIEGMVPKIFNGHGLHCLESHNPLICPFYNQLTAMRFEINKLFGKE